MAMPLSMVWNLVVTGNAAAGFDRTAAAADRAAVATGRATAGTEKFGATAAATSGRAHGVAKSLGAIAAVDIGYHMVKSAVKFQSAMLLIHTQAGRSTAEVKKMVPAVLALAGKTATAPEELAKSLYHVASVGVPVAKALDVVKIAAEGAKIGHADLEQTTNALTSTFVSGIKGAGNFAHAMGMLNAVVGAGDMRMTDLNQALGSGVLTVIKQYGVTLRDAGAALAVFGDNNIRGANAGTMLRMAVQALAVPAKGGSKILGELGLTSEGSAKALGKLHLSTATLSNDLVKGGLNKALHDLKGHLVAAGIDGDHMGTILTQAFGKKAGPGLQILVGQLGRFDQKFKQVWEGGNRFGADWQAWLHSAAGRFDTLKATVQSLGISIGTVLLPVVTSVATVFGHLFSFIQEHSTIFKVLAIGILAVAGSIKAVAVALAVQAKIVAFAQALQFAAVRVGAFFGSTAAAAKLSALETARAETMKSRAVTGSVAEQIAALERLILMQQAQGRGAGVMAMENIAAQRAMMGAMRVGGPSMLIAGQGRGGLGGKMGMGAGMLLGMAAMYGGSKLNDHRGGAREMGGSALSYAGGGAMAGGMVGGPIGAAVGAAGGALLGFAAAQGNHTKDAMKQGIAMIEVLKHGTKAQQDLTMSVHGTKKAVALANHVMAQSLTVVKDMSKADQQYAAMSGYVADKNGMVAASTAKVQGAIRNVATAYNTATQTGSAFLDAVKNFAATAGTAADRAHLIGATLVAANGDALNFASAMNAGAVATKQLGTDIASAAKGIGKGGTSVRSFIRSIVDLKHGTINYSKAAAAPLINDLQGMQGAAMKAAEAQFQHTRAMKGGKVAADAAYTTYKRLTSDALVGQARQLGLTRGQAKKLADQYFGMPGDVKTKIRQIGAAPVETILRSINSVLVKIARAWGIKVNADTGQAQGSINSLQRMVDNLHGKHIVITTDIRNQYSSTHKSTDPRLSGFAAGGPVGNGWFTVGEGNPNTWELGFKQGSQLDFFSNRDSKAMTGMSNPPGFAAGTQPMGDSGSLIAELRRVTAAVERNAQQTADALNGTARKANLHARTMPSGRSW